MHIRSGLYSALSVARLHQSISQVKRKKNKTKYTYRPCSRIFLSNSVRRWFTIQEHTQLTETNDDVLRLLRSVVQVVFENLLSAISVASLSIQSSSRVMGNHSVSTAKRVLHCAPDMVLGGWLDIPHVTCTAFLVSPISIKIPPGRALPE